MAMNGDLKRWFKIGKQPVKKDFDRINGDEVVSVDARTGAVLTYAAFRYGETVEDPQSVFEDALQKMQRLVCIYTELTIGEVDLTYQGYSAIDAGWVFTSILGTTIYKAVCSYDDATLGEWSISEIDLSSLV